MRLNRNRGKESIGGSLTVDLDVQKKADVIEHLKAFDHVGVLANEPPGRAGLPFV
jgi:hypothetical protein